MVRIKTIRQHKIIRIKVPYIIKFRCFYSYVFDIGNKNKNDIILYIIMFVKLHYIHLI